MPKKIDLTGKKYGKLTVLRRVKDDSGYSTWECKCDCGNSVLVDSRRLRRGTTTSCGCDKKGNVRKVGGRTKDITGKRYGKLVALYPLDKTENSGSVLWRCRCDCGNEVDVSVASLNRGNNKSCGCLKKEYQRLVHDRLHLIDGTCVEWLDGRKSRSDNTSGFRGVFRKKNGRYTVSIGFKKKIFYIGSFEEYSDAVEARLRAEKMIHDGFVEANEYWLDRAARDPEWAKKNPFKFDVVKENGILVIHNSVKKFIESDKKADMKPIRDLFLDGADLSGKEAYSEGISQADPNERTVEKGDARSENKKKLVNTNN